METTARIGATLVIKGELRAQEDVAIAGRVEGSVHVTGHTVTVQPGGHVAADINARQIIVAGRVSGLLIADDRIELRETANIEGDMSAPRIVIAEGAEVHGRIDMPAAERPALSLAS
jgi:cytoskeletal protein CcmA (bactofilin family)